MRRAAHGANVTGGSDACPCRFCRLCGRFDGARGGGYDAGGTRAALSLRALRGCRACGAKRGLPSARQVRQSVLACIAGTGQVEHGDAYTVRTGDVFLFAGDGGNVCFSAVRRAERVGNRDTGMKKLIVFDLDGTLAESKSSLDAEMSRLLADLLAIVKVAVISGGVGRSFKNRYSPISPMTKAW